MNHTVDTLKDVMKSASIWHITFIKKNGQKREMNASRDFEFLSENSGELGYETPTHVATYDATDKGLVRVWDCDELGWRSILSASVIDLQAIDAEESDA
jgi:hypothetical protein